MASSVGRETFTFITETEGWSGKVSSQKARKLIRTHVMRNHWAAISSSPIQLTDTFSYEDQQPRSTTKKVRSRLRRLKDGVKDGLVHSPLDPREHPRLRQQRLENAKSLLEVSKSAVNNLELFSCEHLFSCPLYAKELSGFNGITLDFNVKSTGFVDHNSADFHTVICDWTPQNPALDRNNTCALAIEENLENFPALLHAICFHAALLEAANADVSTLSSTSSAAASMFSFPGPTEDDPADSNSEPSLWRTESMSGSEFHALQHKTTAINLLNEFISRNSEASNSSTILCVSFLLAAEAVTGDGPAIDTHRNGLKRLVELWEGHDQLSPGVATQAYLADIKAATTQHNRPSFPLQSQVQQRFNKLTLVPFTSLDIDLTILGSQFFSNSLADQLNIELLKCIQYARHLVHFSEQYQVDITTDTSFEIDEFLLLEYALLILPYETNLSIFEDCIRLSLLLYSNTALWRTPLFCGWVRALVDKLKKNFSTLKWDEILDEFPWILMWMSLLGGHASVGSDEESAWWAARLRHITLALGILEWEGIVDIMKGFFFVDKLRESDWKYVWDVAMLDRSTAVRTDSNLWNFHQ